MDVLIVGGGISGISLAARLADKANVAVAEAEEELGMHATGRSAALLVEAYGPPEIRRLTKLSRTFFEAPPAGFVDAPLARRRGALVYAAEGQVENLRREYETARRMAELLWLDEEAVLEQCPLLRPGVAAAGFIEPNALDLDANALLQGFARAARRAGADILTRAPVTEIRRDGDVWRVAVSDRTLVCRLLVNAAGPWADVVAELAGAPRRGLQPMRRTAATVAPPPELEALLPGTPLTMPIDDRFYFKPEARAIMVSLNDETPSDPCDAWPDDFDVALALDRFHAATVVPPVRPTATWAGLRTFSPDRNPVAGFDPETPGFFWYAGQGGYGIQTSPALSALAARLILGKPPSAEEGELSAALRPGRLTAA